MTGRSPRKYSNTQIALHWAVVGLIGMQWLTAGSIVRTHNPLLPPSQTDLFLHALHNYGGMAIGALVFLRVMLRLVRRSRVGSEWSSAAVAAAVVHWGLYASLAAQATTGFVASYFWGPAAGVHKAIWNVTLTLAALHVAAALWHGLQRDGVIGNMMPRRS